MIYVLIYLWACIFQRIYLLLESRKKFVQSRRRIFFLRSWLVSFLPFTWSSCLPCSWFVGVFPIVCMLLETFVNFVNFKLFRYIFRELAFTAVNQGQTFIITSRLNQFSPSFWKLSSYSFMLLVRTVKYAELDSANDFLTSSDCFSSPCITLLAGSLCLISWLGALVFDDICLDLSDFERGTFSS